MDRSRRIWRARHRRITMRFGRRALLGVWERVEAVELCFGAGMKELHGVTSSLRVRIEL